MEHFSSREQEVIKIVGRKKVTLEQIINELFEDKNKPFDTAISVSNTIRRIIKKCEYYKLNWTYEKTRTLNKLTLKKVKR